MIAGFIILRLRNILGRKTGHQDKVFTNFNEKKFEKFKEEIKKNRIKRLQNLILHKKNSFLKGAEIAYETIINCFF